MVVLFFIILAGCLIVQIKSKMEENLLVLLLGRKEVLFEKTRECRMLIDVVGGVAQRRNNFLGRK